VAVQFDSRQSSEILAQRSESKSESEAGNSIS